MEVEWLWTQARTRHKALGAKSHSKTTRAAGTRRGGQAESWTVLRRTCWEGKKNRCHQGGGNGTGIILSPEVIGREKMEKVNNAVCFRKDIGTLDLLNWGPHFSKYKGLSSCNKETRGRGKNHRVFQKSGPAFLTPLTYLCPKGLATQALSLAFTSLELLKLLSQSHTRISNSNSHMPNCRWTHPWPRAQVSNCLLIISIWV